MFWGFFHLIQATAYYKVLLSKYSFTVSQQKSTTSYLLLTSPSKIGSSPPAAASKNSFAPTSGVYPVHGLIMLFNRIK